MKAPERFETERMHAERMGPAHRDGLIALLGDARVGATLGGVADAAAVDEHIASMDRHWLHEGFGWYTFFDRAGAALVARGGPHRCHVAGKEEVEIGWTVAPARWGEGLATELGAASIAIAFGPLGLDDVVSFTLPYNHASRRVMEKLGFVYERDTDYKGWEHVLYRLSAASARSTSTSVV
jgi:RimJ/RimL family protein N-acetyltransferase